MATGNEGIQHQDAKTQGRKEMGMNERPPFASSRLRVLALTSPVSPCLRASVVNTGLSGIANGSPLDVGSRNVSLRVAEGQAGLPVLWERLCTAYGLVCLVVLLVGTSITHADDSTKLDASFPADVQPLLKTYCYECHSGDTIEGELDFAAFTNLSQVRQHTKVWQKVSEMLLSEQMPPQDAKPLSPEDRAKLHNWVHTVLMIEAAAHAGDPGPVVLRRLSNAEYTYTLRDLTGIETLDPAKEFPVDSASGEGFTNVGNSLVMSPAMITKYLDAGKQVASHAVFLPSGMRFSPDSTRRDWTNAYLAQIRTLYRKYSENGGGSAVNLQGIQFDTNTGGRLPVERYFRATLAEREALTSGRKTIESVAADNELSPKYLGTIWAMLNTPESDPPSLLLAPLRARWKTAQPDELPHLMELVTPWQNTLWKFNSVGQIGLHPDIKAWQVPISPVVTRQDFRVKLPAANPQGEVVLSLAAFDAGDGTMQDQVLWERPRFVSPGRPDLLLKDIQRVSSELARSRDRHFAQTARCLAAAAEAGQSTTPVELQPLATKYEVDEDSLSAWWEYLGIGSSGQVTLGALITRPQERAEAYDFIQGWVEGDALSVVANSSDQHVRIPGNMKPHSIAVHPTPTLSVAVGWRSPLATTLKITGAVQHAHPECGNGIEWALEIRRGNTRQTLATGASLGATVMPIGPLDSIAIRTGDVIALVVSPEGGNNSCDLTAIDLALSDGTHTWDMAQDLSPHILAGNPHADQQGNAGVWSFYSQPTGEGSGHVIPSGSVLAKWQASGEPGEKRRLASDVQTLLQSEPATLSDDSPDAALSKQLRSISGPFMAAVFKEVASKSGDPASVSDSPWGLPASRFGKHPDGRAIESSSLCVQAPDTTEIRLPADLVAGAEFVTTGLLHPETAKDGAVRLQVLAGPASEAQPSLATPILVTAESATSQRIEANLDEFRSLFPAALCYTQIVPVDEDVTLTLYYREDNQLSRLMLSREQAAELDQMWDELSYVSQEPLELITAITQLYQFATQDRPDMLPLIGAQQQPVQDRADAFRQRLLSSEPQQLDAVVQFAHQAYRRPLTDLEQTQLRGLYQKLREEEIGHDDALRLTMARVLVSPAFLYHLEKPTPGTQASPVSEIELASRLSYFLWSSAPDRELFDLAAAGKLSDPEVLSIQAQRMLRDPKARRLATEFGCHWLHIHDFEHLNEKSERHFPTFAALRGAMYEESILVLTDLFQHDRSLLSLVDGDATFLNEELAQHYGIPGVTGPQWRRVEGVRQYSRGSILSLASTMSKQSGASRTSPILRGTWLSEVMLGEKLPKPPKNVPVLSETITEGLTERQMIQRHTSDPACNKCHMRIDPFGYALEGFDAIGRLRTQDAAGLPIDTQTVLFDGTQVDGLSDLKTYLGQTRRAAFVRQFTKKLLGYSLGRAVQLSDEPLLIDIQTQLSDNDSRVSLAIELIVRSRQFREIRGKDALSVE